MTAGPQFTESGVREIIEVRGGHMLRLVAPVARYTRFVAVSKRFLLVLIIAIIGMVIWIASDIGGESGRVVFSGVQQVLPVESVMTKPHYQGVDTNNQPYTVTAEKATQKDSQTVLMQFLRADMALKDGKWIALDAGLGEMNTQTRKLFLSKKVNIFYDGGYEFRTEYMHVDMDESSAHGDAPVEVQGPLGIIKANSFSLVERGAIIRFNGSVITTLYP